MYQGKIREKKYNGSLWGNRNVLGANHTIDSWIGKELYRLHCDPRQLILYSQILRGRVALPCGLFISNIIHQLGKKLLTLDPSRVSIILNIWIFFNRILKRNSPVCRLHQPVGWWAARPAIKRLLIIFRFNTSCFTSCQGSPTTGDQPSEYISGRLPRHSQPPAPKTDWHSDRIQNESTSLAK